MTSPPDSLQTEQIVALERWKPRFFTIWIGQAFSLFGSQLVQFALVWWLAQKTGSATILAIASIAGLFPNVLLGPFAGALIDRWNRRTVMIVADGVIALATLALAVAFAVGFTSTAFVLFIMVIRSIGSVFHNPAMAASTSLMVPKEHLARVSGLNQSLSGVMLLLAPPIAAMLLATVPIQGILAIDVVTAVIAIIPLLIFLVPQPIKKLAKGPIKTTVWHDTIAGFRYILAWPGAVILMCMAAMIYFLMMPSISLTPILVLEHFQGQALQLAWLQMAFGVGSVVGGLFLGAWGGFHRRIVTSLVGMFFAGVGFLVVGFLPPAAYAIAISMVFVIGFSTPIAGGPLIAILQATVDPEMQGRVFTLVNSVIWAMTPLGLLIAGPIADKFGVQVWFLATGVSVILMAISCMFIPAVMHLEDKPNIIAEIELENINVLSPTEESVMANDPPAD